MSVKVTTGVTDPAKNCSGVCEKENVKSNV